MNKKLRSVRTVLLIISTLLVAGLLAFGFYTNENSGSPGRFFPQGAFVYLEAADLHDLLVRWRDSEMRRVWEKSQNYQDFTSSRLYLKLQDRLQKLGAGTSFDLDHLISSAGTRSALALYDIGELRAILITQQSLTQASATELWLSRDRFENRKVDELTYYKDRNGQLVFAYAEPYLIIATDEMLLKQSVALMKQKDSSNSLIDSQKWKLFGALPEGKSTLSIFLDQESLNKNRYFKRYWIHQNVKRLQDIRAIWINAGLNENSLQERRYYVRGNASDLTNREQEQQWVQAYQNALQTTKHEFLSIEGLTNAEEITSSILRLLNRFPEKYWKVSYPPNYSAASQRAEQAEAKNVYLQKIDESKEEGPSTKVLAIDQPERIRNILENAKPAAQIRLAYPLWDDRALFVEFPETLLIKLDQFKNVKPEDLLNELRNYYLTLASTRSNGASIKQLNANTYQLQSLYPLYVRFQEPWIVFSTREEDLNHIPASLPNENVPASFVETDWKNGRWKYSRLMQRLDYGFSGEPSLFFSQNLDSLFYALSVINKTSIHSGQNEETIVYEFQP